VRGAQKLLVSHRRRASHGYLGNLGTVNGDSQLQLVARGNGGIEHGLLRATACIWLETQLVTMEFASQTFGKCRRIITVRLVEPDETKLPQEDVVYTL
jgi:hypothetical protein